jgi:hypothetical protein
MEASTSGCFRVHNDSLGDMISSEEQFQSDYGHAWDPNNQDDVQQLAADIASNKINGGALISYLGSGGDLTALKAVLVEHDDKIGDKIGDADGNTTFTDSQTPG